MEKPPRPATIHILLPAMIYLDHNATTPVCAGALDAMMPFLSGCWANPSSGYRFARVARDAVTKARGQVASLLGVDAEEIVFTGCGTESINTAMRSAMAVFPERRHIVTCATEHDATLACAAELERAGCEVTRLRVGPDGSLDPGELKAALRPGQTALVSLMWANNETGVVHPIAEFAALAGEAGALFHSDAVQAAGKVPLDLNSAAVHYASLSGHKLHAPKGIGVLFVRKTARFHPLLVGGGQENGRRSGTLNVPGIVALGAAAEAASQHLKSDAGSLHPLRDRLESALQDRIPGLHIHGQNTERLPNTSNFRIEGADAQGMVLLLDNAGVCVSTGSACATGSIKPSHVLTAMGLTSRQARETLRLSLSRQTTAEEIERAIEAVAAAAQKLRVTRK